MHIVPRTVGIGNVRAIPKNLAVKLAPAGGLDGNPPGSRLKGCASEVPRHDPAAFAVTDGGKGHVRASFGTPRGVGDFDQTVNITVPDAAWNQYDLSSYLRGSGSLEGFRVYSYNGGGGPDPDYTFLDDVSVNYGATGVDSASLGELKAVFR